MATAKRHHTVPQFYLRGFADDDQIGTVRLEDGRRFPQSVRTAASENHFYTIAGHQDGPDAFEKLLASVEGEVSGIFTKIGQGTWPLALNDRLSLAHFVALQAVRGPQQRRSMELIAAQTARLEIGYGGRANVADWVKRNRGMTITEEQAERVWQQATRPEGPPIRMSAEAHVRQIVTSTEKLLPYIAGRPWTLVRFRRRSLLTSDSPVGLIPNPSDEPWEGVGFLTAWGITLPLTRRLGLLMSDVMPLAEASIPVERVHMGAFDLAQQGTVRMQRFFNQHTIQWSSLYLFHHPEDQDLIPDNLPEPNPATLSMAGGPDEFTGDAMFSGTRQSEP